MWKAGELFDDTLGDGRRTKRISACDDADCRDELFRRVVLQDESAGAGAERLVDVFVEVERRQDDDPGCGVRGEDATPVAISPP